jgi:hypothetical protein
MTIPIGSAGKTPRIFRQVYWIKDPVQIATRNWPLTAKFSGLRRFGFHPVKSIEYLGAQGCFVPFPGSSSGGPRGAGHRFDGGEGLAPEEPGSSVEKTTECELARSMHEESTSLQR